MTSKRRRSPSPTSSSSRHPRLSHPPTTASHVPILPSGKHTISDLFPYQELFLRILSFLSPTELALVQGVNKYWARMSLDPQLWKRLYLSRYPHPHHSRMIYKPSALASSSPDRPLRPIARLPSRAFPPPSPSRSPSASPGPRRTPDSGRAAPSLDSSDDEVGWGVRNDGVDWKMMLRLGTNWSNGNASSQSTIPLPPSPSPSAPPLRPVETETSSQPASPTYTEQHIALFPSLIFTTSPTSPLVHAHLPTSSSQAPTASSLGIIPPPPGWSSPHRPDNVTSICADLSPPIADESGTTPSRLGIFYQSGGFVVVRVILSDDGRMVWKRESVHPAQRRPPTLRTRSREYAPVQGDPVVLSSLHFPVLLTCTAGFHLSVYLVDRDPPLRLSTMHSDVSSHPAALSLLPDTANLTTGNTDDTNGPTAYKAALTYCTPLYPSSWTVAVQELSVDLSRPHRPDVRRHECWHVGHPPSTSHQTDVIWPKRIQPIAGVKGTATGVGMDGRWAVLAGEDNQIQVYSLPAQTSHLPTPSPSPPLQPITHAETLLAHQSSVTTLALSGGRCVSGGRDGRVLVWELDDLDGGDDDGEYRKGRTVGYVEVRPGGRRKVWRGAAGPERDAIEDADSPGEETWKLPHPASISSAARSLFLPRPPGLAAAGSERAEEKPAIRQLAFDEERIVGVVRAEEGEGEVLRVWSFNS